MKQDWILWGLGLALAAALRFCFEACDYIAYVIALLCLVWAARQGLKALGRKRKTLARNLGVLMTILLCLFGIWFAATELYLITGAKTDTAANPDYIVVLGAQVRGDEPSRSMADRVAAAAEYLQEHPDTICIVSGGQGPGENQTEAACMRDMLFAAGIDPGRIWLEEQAVDTAQNIAFSLDLVEQRTGVRPRELGIVSSEYHLRRAVLVARRQGCEASGIAAPTSLLFLKVNYFIREAFGIWYYALLK